MVNPVPEAQANFEAYLAERKAARYSLITRIARRSQA
jgi:hypothetical protein